MRCLIIVLLFINLNEIATLNEKGIEFLNNHKI